MTFAVGRKLGMTQIEKDDKFVGVSIFEALPLYVTQIKKEDRDGYKAIQVGMIEEKKKSLKKPQEGHIKKIKLKQKPTKLKEFRIEFKKDDKYKLGEKLEMEVFKEGQKVDAKGVSIGKGFQGTIKRFNAQRGPETHGSNHHRAPGAIGMCSFPGRVFKGKKMPGRMGANKVTVKNLKIIKVIKDKNLILLKGSLPGKRGSEVVIKGE